jgi:hypothetical protein
LNVKKVSISVPDDVNTGAVPPTQSTLAGQVNEYAPAFTAVNVNPNAFEAGGLLNVIVAVPLNCLLKLFAVDRSNVTLPPVPWSEYVSLNVVAAINVEAAIDVVTVTFPVTDNVLPLNVKLSSALTFGDVPSNVNTALSVTPLIVANPDVPFVPFCPCVPDVPELNPAGEVPDVPLIPALPDVPDVIPGVEVPDEPDEP